MVAKTPVWQRVASGVGGALVIASLFLPWAAVDGAHLNGWDFNTVAALYFPICGAFGILTAVTGGQYGFMRPDVSIIGGTDLLNVISMLLFVWLLFNFPENATREYGVYAALIFTAIAAFPIADYRPLRGAPWFPPVKTGEAASAGTSS